MLSVQLCTLAILLVASAVPSHGLSNGMKQVVADCGAKHNVDHNGIRDAMRNPKPEDGCLINCVMERAFFKLEPDSPMGKDLAACKESVPMDDDKCLYAYKLKNCLNYIRRENYKKRMAATQGDS